MPDRLSLIAKAERATKLAARNGAARVGAEILFFYSIWGSLVEAADVPGANNAFKFAAIATGSAAIAGYNEIRETMHETQAIKAREQAVQAFRRDLRPEQSESE
ncbi:MAG TPA: hypothetical protein VFH39_02480 [Candidatus Saccharimonadales bacterium]|nr:hypothetical protein [Candidatus Saccharimonadales bacterium]